MIDDLDEKILKELTPNEKDLLNYINSNKFQIYKMSIHEFAQSTYVSTATVLRLCKKLGFNGFNELKFNLKKSLTLKNKGYDSSIGLNGLLSRRLLELKETMLSLNLEQLDSIVDYLCSDKNIHIFGRGLTQMSLEYLYNILISLNRQCMFYLDPPLVYQTASQMDENDVFIIGSFGGSTDPIVKAVEISKNNTGTVIAITSNPNSELAKKSDIVLIGKTQNRFFSGIDINSRLSIQFIVEIIIELYMSRMNIVSH
ncbi:RpiR family transcriptional regulator [Clostridium botulinum B str. Osaka05]|uniref:RpiR family transcriptional regulator n=1 Tax=Clostridium botulinum B str. Osaka05 TaxID=1407017 RepID=A0A0S6TX93_CLOBO|nr:MurR/RpiR family transcriptional regulator [Clostridium botulinum]GAE00710.1 RpiR family transcriptional regulator [Clostridium botulinum B str. Osaka05]